LKIPLIRKKILDVAHKFFAVPKIYQFAHFFPAGDGLGNLGVILDKQYKREGFETRLYSVEEPQSDFYQNIYNIRNFNYDLDETDTAILHFTMDSEINDLVAKLKCRKVFYYHNITPAGFFKNYDQYIYNITLEGRRKLNRYAKYFDKCITPSCFNKKELLENGFKNIKVSPLPKDFSMLAQPPDENIKNTFSDDFVNFFFPGRILPHKNHKFLTDILLHYKSFYNKKTRLLLPGAFDDIEYKKDLEIYIAEKKVEDIIFFGRINQNILNALYRTAHVFICASEHEGYCMPIIEAMYFSVPILALDRGAVSETVSDGGIVIKERNPELFCAAVSNILNDLKLANRLKKNQKRILRTRYGYFY